MYHDYFEKSKCFGYNYTLDKPWYRGLFSPKPLLSALMSNKRDCRQSGMAYLIYLTVNEAVKSASFIKCQYLFKMEDVISVVKMGKILSHP